MSIIVILSMMVPSFKVFAQETNSGVDPFFAAYQKEFVFLDNEIRILNKRIREVEREGAQRIADAEERLLSLDAELLDLTSRIDRRIEERRVVEAAMEKADDTAAMTASIINQGNQRLSKNGITPYQKNSAITESEQMEAELDHVFEKSIEILGLYGKIGTVPGVFFMKDGKEANGEIVNIGRIACYGISGETGGTLAPIGGGNLSLIDEKTAPLAKKLAEGAVPSSLPVFLYESLEKPAQSFGQHKTILDTIKGGGIIGLTIIVIGCAAFFLIIVRTFLLFQTGRSNTAILGKLMNDVENGSMIGALAYAEKLPGAIGRVLADTLGGIIEKCVNIEDIVSESILNEQKRLTAFRSAITVFAAVAPLLGLLGTVTGMISTFEVITQFGTGDPKLLSGGISEALITTEFGLMVAIPVLLFGNLLTSRADRITTILEVTALRVLNISAGPNDTGESRDGETYSDGEYKLSGIDEETDMVPQGV
ncbi:MAG: MotA/TolQ/ExbB proton channel family protein [Spirochaetales bacterium]|nr:MotA/TolQ/ExbB proton channel family protein [Spirochaetales bacterium]